MASRLANESSPYLKQHVDNPVDWWPWGEDAFAEAKRRDVPVFLSIGYATCHWCHVMAHESFEDNEAAQKMNDAFVCIKVDREERPDIDEAYMAVTQAMTGRGGWPMTVLLTPEKQPFFAGTYFPKQSRGNHVGLLELIDRVTDAWKTKRGELIHQAKHVVSHLQAPAKEGVKLTDENLVACAGAFAKRFDSTYGGFGGAPKFPSPTNLLWLQHYSGRDPKAAKMVEITLQNIVAGGIHDHVGGGFHRYATDSNWLTPHFEKMLYDQGQLLYVLSVQQQIESRPEFAAAAQGIVEYVRRDLLSPQGAFYSAEDADSDGEEGTFYVWTKQQFMDVVDSQRIAEYFGVTDEGNYHDEATGKPTGTNILHTKVSKRASKSEQKLAAALTEAKQQLRVRREQRNRPLLDDKILVDWNCLMIAGLAKAGSALAEPTWVEMAEKAMDYLLREMYDNGIFSHRIHGTNKDNLQLLDDQAYALWALIELYEATQKPDYLATAKEVAGKIIEAFEMPRGFTKSANPEPGLPSISPDAYDGAIISGNSCIAWQFARLGLLLGDNNWTDKAWELLGQYSHNLAEYPQAYPGLHLALDLLVGPTEEVCLGRPEPALLAKLQHKFAPRRVWLTSNSQLAAIAPWTTGLVGAQVYACAGNVCNRPVPLNEYTP